MRCLQWQEGKIQAHVKRSGKKNKRGRPGSDYRWNTWKCEQRIEEKTLGRNVPHSLTRKKKKTSGEIAVEEIE